jgi:hypothetical protein
MTGVAMANPASTLNPAGAGPTLPKSVSDKFRF